MGKHWDEVRETALQQAYKKAVEQKESKNKPVDNSGLSAEQNKKASCNNDYKS